MFADLISLSPQVTRRIIATHVSDNQDVKEGDLLPTIDPVPFQLALDQHRAEVDEARAQIASNQNRITSAQAAFTAAASTAGFAQETQTRLATLEISLVVSRVQLDQADDALRRANAARDAAQDAVALAQSTLFDA